MARKGRVLEANLLPRLHRRPGPRIAVRFDKFDKTYNVPGLHVDLLVALESATG